MAIRSKIKSFGYSTVIYGFSNLLTKIVAVTLIPLYTNYLSVYEVGIIALLEMVELFVVTLIPMGCVNAMWRYLPNEKTSIKHKIIISSFTVIIISGFLITAVLLFFKNSLINILNIDTSINLISYVIVSCFLRAISNFIYWILQYRNQAFSYLILSLTQFISLIGLTIYFIIGIESGVIGIYYAKIIVFSILLIATIFFLLKTVPAMPSLNLMKKLLLYGLPIIPLILYLPVLTVSDRYFLQLYGSVEDVGRYGIAYKFGMLINMFLVLPIQKSWGPQMFQVGIASEDNKKIHQDITFYYSFIGQFIIISLSFFADTILTVFANKNYLEVSWVIPWISLAYFIGGFKIFLMASASLADRTDLFIKTGLLTISANLFLNFFLIKEYGVLGAVSSTIISYIILIFLLFIYSRGLNNIIWPIKKIIHGTVLTILIISVFNIIKDYNFDYEIMIKFILLMSFPVLSILTKLIGSKEISGIKYLWKIMTAKIIT
tara:strand:- start:1431 stop:2900 length:1470 start_codon:yes stop_codon:yes gene_type:complete